MAASFTDSDDQFDSESENEKADRICPIKDPVTNLMHSLEEHKSYLKGKKFDTRTPNQFYCTKKPQSVMGASKKNKTIKSKDLCMFAQEAKSQSR